MGRAGAFSCAASSDDEEGKDVAGVVFDAPAGELAGNVVAPADGAPADDGRTSPV